MRYILIKLHLMCESCGKIGFHRTEFCDKCWEEFNKMADEFEKEQDDEAKKQDVIEEKLKEMRGNDG